MTLPARPPPVCAAPHRPAVMAPRGGMRMQAMRDERAPSRCVAAALLASAALGLTPVAASAADCTALAGATLLGSAGTVTDATMVPAGGFTAGTVTYSIPAAFCRVQATLRPSPDSEIKVEAWLPEGAAWNGRYLGTGNGGYAGAIRYDELAGGVQLGFATINTDMGTAPSTALDGRPIIGRPEKWIDWGYRSTHLMTVAGKELLQAYYGQGAQFSYFLGCSTGGGQALHEAQQFPEDYDGIMAGAPANNRTHVHTNALWNYDVTHRSAESLIPVAKLALMTKAVLDACVTRSGGVAGDAYLTDPRLCRWDPAEIACAEDATDTSQCLLPAQVTAARQIYDGPRNPRTGHLIFPGAKRGSESGSTFDWAAMQGISIPSDIPQFSGLFYWAFGPNWDWRSFDYDRDMAQLDDLLHAILNANDPDLGRFSSRGGKLIGFHGYADPLVPTQDFINYYERVAALDRGEGSSPSTDTKSDLISTVVQGPESTSPSDGTAPAGSVTKTAHYFRLFLAPGMGHCGGGPGPNQFGNAQPFPVPADPQHNLLLALQRWVEEGVPPASVVATKFVGDQPTSGVAQTRILCPYPRVARYTGQGDPNDAANFTCVAGRKADNPMAAPEYLR
ncbi:tannase/feruloyl esterase family alpha/beta hydrolase [Paracraurococcus lichenis]|uniref:Tannase/feruloyl esterase family alpha/beta hydrolase n=1 Tax=Paracraurococcus lichenis TaxID=3064888 RepID=A0ABT9EAL4_9PROT|nr:tannase/feruloyl esterase family alpha/beta hydrolase [Paracraurococcus sp. LOR1-02]MDO9713105.1 tannase/feruloyl esterase family alpha/beta hydrolase [Paracraurococcus sp. LOR1-02]